MLAVYACRRNQAAPLLNYVDHKRLPVLLFRRCVSGAPVHLLKKCIKLVKRKHKLIWLSESLRTDGVADEIKDVRPPPISRHSSMFVHLEASIEHRGTCPCSSVPSSTLTPPHAERFSPQASSSFLSFFNCELNHFVQVSTAN